MHFCTFLSFANKLSSVERVSDCGYCSIVVIAGEINIPFTSYDCLKNNLSKKYSLKNFVV